MTSLSDRIWAKIVPIWLKHGWWMNLILILWNGYKIVRSSSPLERSFLALALILCSVGWGVWMCSSRPRVRVVVVETAVPKVVH